MKRDERKRVQAIHDASGELLAAKTFAETYMARRAFLRSLHELDAWVAVTHAAVMHAAALSGRETEA